MARKDETVTIHPECTPGWENDTSLFPTKWERYGLRHGEGEEIEIICDRDGQRALRFMGWRIGHARHAVVEIDIFAVKREFDNRSRYVVAIRRLAIGGLRTPGLRSGSAMVALVCHSEADVLQALTEDNGGELGVVGKQAWDEACGNLPQRFASYQYEMVD